MAENEIKDDDGPMKGNMNEEQMPLFKPTENELSGESMILWEDDKFVWDLSEL